MPSTTANAIRYHIRETGTAGPLVVLGHSDASSSAQWRLLMEELAGEFRMRAFDTSGQGRSQPWPEGLRYSVSAESEIVDALVESETERFHLVGHSAGAMFLLGAALRLNERLASLTLIEPVMFALLRLASKEDAWAEVTAMRREFQGLVRADNLEEAMRMFVDYWTMSGNWDAMAEDRRAEIMATARKIYLQWDAALYDEHTLDEYARITCPTLLIRGANTTLAARSVADVLHDTLPNLELVEIEGAGHMLPLTHAADVNRHIAEHLRGRV